jgi:hypothetical protein
MELPFCLGYFRLVAPIAISMFCFMCQTPNAYAQSCRQWSIDGEFQIQQGNGYLVNLYPRQVGERFSGYGYHSHGHGKIEGFISKVGQFKLVATWNNGSVGDYTGFVNSQGNIEDGRAYDRTNPSVWSTWWNLRPLTCAVR